VELHDLPRAEFLRRLRALGITEEQYHAERAAREAALENPGEPPAEDSKLNDPVSFGWAPPSAAAEQAAGETPAPISDSDTQDRPSR
jgi:hypothetical protein